MSFFRMFRIAWKNLLINKRRSFLTMLGIIIGIFSVVVVMSVGAGVQSLIVDQIKQRGTDQIAILAGASDESGPPASVLGVVITTLTNDDAQALLNKNNVSHIETVASYISGNDVLRWESEERNVTYTGATATYKTLEKVTMKEGRFFSSAEEESGDHVMVMGARIAEEIFGNQNPIGEFVKLKRQNFKVVGVMDRKGSDAFENIDDSVVIPLTAAQRDLLGVRHVTFIRAIVEDEQYIEQTVEEVKQVLIDRHGDEDFSVRNIADALQILETVTDALRLFLVSIAAIALFVGGVGIMNIMLIAVKEKTREIGLRKSFGARNSDILWQFLVETIVLTFIGVCVGFVIGVLMSYIIAFAIQTYGFTYEFSISPITILIAIMVALIIGFLFGIIPARKAAQLHPIDALRYE